MATAFPALCPTRRDFTPGDYPVKRFTAINGAGTTRIYGDSAFDAQLRLEFLANDDGLASILECWHDAKGQFDQVTLPTQLYDGFGPQVLAQIRTYLTWRWAERPQVASLLNGRFRVSVNLIGTLDS